MHMRILIIFNNVIKKDNITFLKTRKNKYRLKHCK